MNRINLLVPVLVAIFFSCSRSPASNPDRDRREIIRLLADQRKYHLAKNAQKMAEMHSSRFISIDKGQIDSPAFKEVYNKFNNYFNRVEFVKWDDKQPPIVRFSNDGSVAYAAVSKLVILRTKDKTQKEILDTTNFAWLAVFKKENDSWTLDCIASTNK
jgi:hypothetical protein